LENDDMKHKNYAMRNIHKRLKLLYGAQAEFQIYSEVNIGTRVNIYLPMSKLKGAEMLAD